MRNITSLQLLRCYCRWMDFMFKINIRTVVVATFATVWEICWIGGGSCPLLVGCDAMSKDDSSQMLQLWRESHLTCVSGPPYKWALLAHVGSNIMRPRKVSFRFPWNWAFVGKSPLIFLQFFTITRYTMVHFLSPWVSKKWEYCASRFSKPEVLVCWVPASCIMRWKLLEPKSSRLSTGDVAGLEMTNVGGSGGQVVAVSSKWKSSDLFNP